MGQWSHLVGQYPEKREASLALRQEYLEMEQEELERLLSEQYKKKKNLEAEFGRAKQVFTAISEVLMDKWAVKETTQTRRDGIGTLSKVDDVFARISDLDEFKLWADENGLGNLVQEVVNPTSLTSTVKQLMLKGDEIPEGISIHTKSRIKVTQSKQKGST